MMPRRNLSQYTPDVTKQAKEGLLDPVIGRDEELDVPSSFREERKQPCVNRRAWCW